MYSSAQNTCHTTKSNRSGRMGVRFIGRCVAGFFVLMGIALNTVFSVGLGVHAHICKSKGERTVGLFVKTNPCTQPETPATTKSTRTCCKPPKKKYRACCAPSEKVNPTQEVIDKSCCVEHTRIVYQDTDGTTSALELPNPPVLLAAQQSIRFRAASSRLRSAQLPTMRVRPPPIKAGRAILRQSACLRI